MLEDDDAPMSEAEDLAWRMLLAVWKGALDEIAATFNRSAAASGMLMIAVEEHEEAGSEAIADLLVGMAEAIRSKPALAG